MEVKRVGPIICGQQSAHVAVEAFGAEGEVLILDQAEEAAVKENLLQRAPRMFIEVMEDRRERAEALKAAVDAARQQGLAPACGDRLRWLVLEKYPGAFRRALCGEPPARVEPMVV